MHHFRCLCSGVEETGRRGNGVCTESGCGVERLDEMRWSVERQDDASETEGKGLQNCTVCCMGQCPGRQREDKKHD